MDKGFCYDLGARMNGGALQKSRITRSEAAKVLGTSYANVRKLQQKGFLHSNPDRYGVHRFDRREVEELARRRGLQIKPSGELAARVFQMFKARARFEDVVIQTQQEPDVILALWKRFRAGFEDPREATPVSETLEQDAHDRAMRELDAEIERRRGTG